MERSLVKLLGLVKTVTKMVTGCLRAMKVTKSVLVRYEKYGTLCMHVHLVSQILED